MRYIITAILFIGYFLTVEASSDRKQTILLSSTHGAKIALDLAGMSDTYFYDISQLNKQQTAEVYFQNIDINIGLVRRDIRSLAKGDKKPATVVAKTLKKMSEAVNQLIVDSSENASYQVIQEDIAQIDAVVRAFSVGFPKSLYTGNRLLPCRTIQEAEVALHVFAQNIEIYVSQLNKIAFHASLDNQKLVSANNIVVSSLGHFVESCALSTYITYN